MLDAVLLNMKLHGHIAICGMISQYNLTHPEPLKNSLNIAFKRLTIKGITYRDHHHHYPKLLETVLPYIRNTKCSMLKTLLKDLKKVQQL
jgi:2-alkenal reductase (NADP+)